MSGKLFASWFVADITELKENNKMTKADCIQCTVADLLGMSSHFPFWYGRIPVLHFLQKKARGKLRKNIEPMLNQVSS